MAKSENLAFLIRSLSKMEKRYFKLYSGLHEGNKEYMRLFQLFENETSSLEEVKAKFQKQSKGASFEMAGKHLYKVLIRSLVLYENENSVENKILLALQESKILFEKQVYDECFKVIDKAKSLADKYQNNLYLLLILKQEIQFLVQLDFIGVSEDELIAIQKRTENCLKNETYVHNHGTLYELLYLRSLEMGHVRSREEQDKLNDLVMGEMQLYSIPKYDSFESNKIHLLFQSAYFSMTGDNKSSLKNFYELDKLFEENKELWQDPPIYYIQHLQGIIQNLRKMGKHDEMQYFIGKLAGVETKSVNARQIIDSLVYQYQVQIEIDHQTYDKALEIKREYEEKKSAGNAFLSPNSEARLEMYNALIYYGLKEYKSAIKHVNNILNKGKIFKALPIYKTIRLISLIIHFDRYKFDYIDYEMRSFQRQLAKREKIFQTEKVVFGFMKKYMNTLSKSRHRQLIDDAIIQLNELSDDRYESQILNEFDFVEWLENKK